MFLCRRQRCTSSVSFLAVIAAESRLATILSHCKRIRKRMLNTVQRTQYVLDQCVGTIHIWDLALRWRGNISRKRLHVRSTVVRLANEKQSYAQDCAKSESSNRTIPLTPKAISLLQMLAEDAENEWDFWNDDGQRLAYEALRFQTQCLCKAAGVPYRGEHVFRHTFATNCYHKRVDVRILSRLMGHADVDITYNICVHVYGD